MRNKERAARLRALANTKATKEAAKKQLAPNPPLPQAQIVVDPADSLERKADYLVAELERTMYEIQILQDAPDTEEAPPQEAAQGDIDWDGWDAWEDVERSLNDLRPSNQAMG
jgi:hypothetical protein